jgi:hypothetical protein
VTARAGAVFSLAVVILACNRQSPQDDFASASATNNQHVDDRASEAKREIASAYAAFTGSRAGSAERRRSTYVALVAVQEKSKSVPAIASHAGIPSRQAEKLLARLDALTAADAAETESLAMPDQPQHEPPKYEGAFPLGGAVRKCFQDGVALESNGRFYFVKDAECPVLSLLHGYVENTGDTVKLDLGRDGRDAAVVAISDAEKAQDDQQAHRKAVSEYEADYAKLLQEYRAAIKTRGPILAAAKKSRPLRAQERQAVETELDGILLTLAGGKPAEHVNEPRAADVVPAPTNSAVASAPVEAPSELRGAQASPRPVSNAGPAAPPHGAATDSVAKSSTAPATNPEDARRACIASCVGRCSGDANCEHACVTSKCR